MAVQSCSCFFAPMSVLTLSFTIDLVPLLRFSVEDHLEFCRLSARVLPYHRHYSEAFAYSRLLYPPNIRRSLRSGSSACAESLKGLPCCIDMTTTNLGFTNIPAGLKSPCCQLRDTDSQPAHHFGFGVSACFTDAD
jgi:hypothetical protein